MGAGTARSLAKVIVEYLAYIAQHQSDVGVVEAILGLREEAVEAFRDDALKRKFVSSLRYQDATLDIVREAMAKPKFPFADHVTS